MSIKPVRLSRRETLRLLAIASGGIAVAGMTGCTSALSNALDTENEFSMIAVEGRKKRLKDAAKRLDSRKLSGLAK